jgi:hypothetical protein
MAILPAVYDQPTEKSLRFSMVLILLINVFGSTIQPATEVSGPRGQIIRAARVRGYCTGG